MSDLPFGFGRPPDDDPEKRGTGGSGAGSSGGGSSGGGSSGGGGVPENPFASLFGSAGPADLGAALQQLGRLLQWEGGPVNWDLAEEVARQAVSASGDRVVTGKEGTQATEAMRLAELWLDAVTSLPSGATSTSAWSRAEWVDATLPVWRQLCDPVAGHVVEAMGKVLPSEAQPMAGPLLGMMRQMGGALFGAQLGQAIGSLAGEVIGSSDVGVPVGPAGHAALLPLNVAAFGEGLGVAEDEVRLFLALREAAHHRLFGHVPWLRAHVLAAVEDYARGIEVDMSRLEEAVGSIDPSNPQALQEALSGDMLAPQDTPEQKAALTRLETVLALVEGWVDEVVADAARDRLPSAEALRETVRRRRATGGPAEQTFSSLVGLQLRPRRLRDAAALWRALAEARGVAGRDDVWAHPDLLPDAADLDDPNAFVSRDAASPLDLSALEGTEGAEDTQGAAEPGSEARDDAPEDGSDPEGGRPDEGDR